MVRAPVEVNGTYACRGDQANSTRVPAGTLFTLRPPSRTYGMYCGPCCVELTVETDSPISSVSGETVLNSIPTTLHECLER
jgi:hypothetical protein